MKKALVSAALGFSLAACATFDLSYQNYFTKNFAYVAAGYSGNPNEQRKDGVESNDMESPNRSEYSAAEYANVSFGFRSLEHHNSRYTSGNHMDELIVGTYVSPKNPEPVTFVTLDMSGKNISAKPGDPAVKSITLLKQSYPALLVNFDNKALQASAGSGTYTIVWKSLKADGKAESRELSRVVTQLNP